MKRPTVNVTAYAESLASVRWDAQSFTISCNVDYDSASSLTETKGNLSEALERQFNMSPPSYVITGGTLSLLLDSEKRLKEFDFYTNPGRWAECTFPFVDAISATPHIEAIFDENGRSEDMGEPEEFYEPVRGTFYLSWGEALTWYVLAPLVAIGVANDNSLVQIRLDGLHAQTTEQKAPGLLGKLRHRFGFR